MITGIDYLVKHAHALALEKGWHPHPPSPEGVVSLIGLIHSEIVEFQIEASRTPAADRFGDLPSLGPYRGGLPAWLEVVHRGPGQPPRFVCLNEGSGPAEPATGTGDGKPRGVLIELADVVIRTADLWGLCGWPVPTEASGVYTAASLDEAALFLHRIAASITECVRRGETPRQSALSLLIGGVLQAVRALLIEHRATFTGLDEYALLAAAVACKHDFNRTRPHRHGGKLA